MPPRGLPCYSTGMTQFKRTAPGQYTDAASGWTITRDGGQTARYDRSDWLVKDASGTVQRVRPTKAEAEMVAHDALTPASDDDMDERDSYHFCSA